MPTQSEMHRASAQAMARRFAIDAADGMYEVANKAVDNAEAMLMWLEELPADPDKIDELRRLLRDTLGDVQGEINRTLDREGETDAQHQVDVSGLERMEEEDR